MKRRHLALFATSFLATLTLASCANSQVKEGYNKYLNYRAEQESISVSDVKADLKNKSVTIDYIDYSVDDVETVAYKGYYYQITQTVSVYTLTDDTTFQADTTYYTYTDETFSAASVTTGDTVTTEKYFEKTSESSSSKYSSASGTTTSTFHLEYRETTHETFQSGVNYYVLNDEGDYEAASVTVGNSTSGDTTYYVAYEAEINTPAQTFNTFYFTYNVTSATFTYDGSSTTNWETAQKALAAGTKAIAYGEI